jgi:hypothetical protein
MVVATRFSLLILKLQRLILKPNRFEDWKLKVPYQNVIGGMMN